MRTINIHEAKTHLSCLVDQVAAGEPFIIAKAGKPMAKGVPLDAPASTEMRRLGFMEGQGTVLDDFDEMARDEIEQLFAWTVGAWTVDRTTGKPYIMNDDEFEWDAGKAQINLAKHLVSFEAA